MAQNCKVKIRCLLWMDW